MTFRAPIVVVEKHFLLFSLKKLNLSRLLLYTDLRVTCGEKITGNEGLETCGSRGQARTDSEPS